jgi:hypothetical protein
VEKYAEKKLCLTFHCFADDSYDEHLNGVNVLRNHTIRNCWPYWDKFEQREPYNKPNTAKDGEHYGVEHHKRFAEIFLKQFQHKLK